MAVLSGLVGVDVTVRVNSIQVTEHSTVTSSPHAVTTYISADPNTEFEVFLSILSEYKIDCPTLGFDIYVDGVKLAAKCCLQSKRGWMKEWVRPVQGAEIGCVIICCFIVNIQEPSLELGSRAPGLQGSRAPGL
jgi:hypothetical protein